MTKTDQNSLHAKYRLLFRLFGQERGLEILKLMQEGLLDYRYGNYIADVIREIAIGKGQITESLEHVFPPTTSSKGSRVTLVA
ncbi:MAG: hypothetical protein HYY67_00535 [Thaumarchaeota archaeon]|nr:hypothetical protein [Nitrososphaerota archaeon]